MVSEELITNLSEEICEGDSYPVGTSVYTTSGTYTNVLTSTSGCDSTVNLTLTVHPILTETVLVDLCSGDSYQGNVYTSDTTYTTTLTSSLNCDSLVTTEITVYPVYSETLEVSLCAGESYEGITYTTSTTLTDNYQTINGCDSTIITEITVLPHATASLDIELCYGAEYQGISYTESTILIEEYTAANGCDSTLTINLNVSEEITVELTEEICEGESYPVGTSVYTTSGTYTDVLTSISGCDSTVNLTLTVHPILTETVALELCSGDSYDGNVYTSDTTYTTTLTSSLNCDSIVTTEITVYPVYSETLEVSLCAGESYEGITYTTSTTLTDSYQTINGCDSTIITEITVLPHATASLDIELCYGAEYDGVSYTESTTLTEEYTAANGCDSTLTINLNVLDEITVELTEEICEGESYELGGILYSTTGVYFDVLTSAAGCDSTVTIDLTVVDIYTSTVNASICEGETYFAGGAAQSVAGTYVDTFANSNGCPSVLRTILTVWPTYEETQNVSICNGESYFVGGAEQTTAGLYQDILQTTNGCDSVILTQLNILPTYQDTVYVSICDGETHFAAGENQSTAGFYVDNYLTVAGCDSVIVTALEIRLVPTISIPHTICEGDTLYVGTNYYTQSGNYTDTLLAANGCDSLVTHLLEVIDSYETYVEEVICEGDSIYLDGAYQYEAGEFIETYTSSNGCDSVVTTELIVEPVVELFAEDYEICFGEEIQLLVDGSENVMWYPATGLSCTDCIDPVASPTQTTTYTVTANSCLGTTVETIVTVTVHNPPSLTVSSNADVVEGDEITVSAVSNDPNAIISWMRDGEMICDDCSEITVEPGINMLFEVQVEDEFGCTNYDEINIRVNDACRFSRFEIPNMISPNGDGFNDYFEIKYEGVSDVSLLRIYNRWGELVYETNNIDSHWDGTFRGSKLNPGVYVYYIEGHCLDDEVFMLTGNVTILK